jgi:hypothetical protein
VGSRWAAPTLGSVYFWMILAVWCAVMYRTKRTRADR